MKVLSETLILLHPIIPFITEEIFEQSQKLQSNSNEKLISKAFPEPEEGLFNIEAESEIEWLKKFILGIRKIRGEMNISPGKPLQCFIKNFNSQDKNFIEKNKLIIFTLAKLDNIDLLELNEEEPESAIALVGEMQILIPLSGLINKDAEKDRLNKEIDKLIKLKAQFSGKLNNKKFISGAPGCGKNANEKQTKTLRRLARSREPPPGSPQRVSSFDSFKAEPAWLTDSNTTGNMFIVLSAGGRGGLGLQVGRCGTGEGKRSAPKTKRETRVFRSIRKRARTTRGTSTAFVSRIGHEVHRARTTDRVELGPRA